MSVFYRRLSYFRNSGKINWSPVASFTTWEHGHRSRMYALFGAAMAGTAYLFVNKENHINPFIVQCAESDCAGGDKKCEDSACLRKMDKEEEMIAKANSELEKALKDVKPKVVEYTEAALKAFCEASELIKQFMDKAYCAIEEDGVDSPRFEEVWCDVYDVAVKRCEKVKDALQKGQCAWELLCRLREVIENGKACKYTHCNPLLVTAEETLLCAERELLNAKSKMDCIQAESRLVEQYRNLVESFRRDLKAEVDSLIPGEDCKGTLTDNEVTMVITHAYKKVLRAQKELAQVQVCTEQTNSYKIQVKMSVNNQTLERYSTSIIQLYDYHLCKTSSSDLIKTKN